MGLWGTWVLCRKDESRQPVDGWEPWGGLHPSWSGFFSEDPADPVALPESWTSASGPLLVASVMDSGFCLLTGIVDGVITWRCVINEDNFVAEAPSSVVEAFAGDRRRTVDGLAAWVRSAELPEPSGLDDVLDEGYIQAESGFHAFLDALGLLVQEPRPPQVAELPALPPLPDPVTEPAQRVHITRDPRLALEVDTYVDLYTRLDAVADWLDALRSSIVEPAIAQAHTVQDFDPRDGDETVTPGTLFVQVNCWSMKRRFTTAVHDERSWRRMRARLLKGELREVGIGLVQYTETAPAFCARGSNAWFRVDLRSIHVDDSGPLPNGYPAQFVVEIDDAWEGTADRVALLRELLTSTATRFDAAYGYLSSDQAGGTGTYEVTSSPYESRSGAHTHPSRRLDEFTRGVHWCTVLGPEHVDAVGGPGVLRDTDLFHRSEQLGQSGSWLLQLTEDPDTLTHAAVDRAAWELRAVMPRRLTGNLGLTS